MKEKCQAAFITANGQVEFRTMEIPELKDNEVLVRVHASLISPGTENGYAACIACETCGR